MVHRSRTAPADHVFHVLCVLGAVLPLCFVAWFVMDTLLRAWPGLSNPTVRIGLLLTLMQSAQIIGLALALALPIGIGAAIFLEHLAYQRFFAARAQRAIALLAAVPSVLYGLFGLTVFTALLGVQSIFLTASITLALFFFPIIVERTRAALQTVPSSLHDASLALGADPWRALVHVVLPLAWPKLAAEVLHLVARALGTAAPLLVVGMLAPMHKVAVVQPLAVQLFDSSTDPDPTQQTVAAAAVILLLVLVVTLYGMASWLSGNSTTTAQRVVREGSSERGVV